MGPLIFVAKFELEIKMAEYSIAISTTMPTLLIMLRTLVRRIRRRLRHQLASLRLSTLKAKPRLEVIPVLKR